MMMKRWWPIPFSISALNRPPLYGRISAKDLRPSVRPSLFCNNLNMYLYGASTKENLFFFETQKKESYVLRERSPFKDLQLFEYQLPGKNQTRYLWKPPYESSSVSF